MTSDSPAALCSQKLQRFGALGAGIVLDSLASVQLAGALSEARALPKEEEEAKPPAKVEFTGGPLSRKQVLDILEETVRVQGIVQQEVSVLARKLAKEKGHKNKRPKSLSFVDGHKRILELNLPREPLEDHGLTEAAFQRVLLDYEEDAEVMASAQKLLHPVGKGDPERARSITMDKIVEIHQFMVSEMQRVLTEFAQLPRDVRHSFSSKGCETTAELLVSIAVEQQLSVRCEDVEQAVISYEEVLQGNPEFTRCTEQLANMMQHLIGAAQPRAEKASFLKVLKQMGESTRQAKAFAKKLYEDYRAKSCSVADAYRRFSAFTEEQAAGAGEEVPELSPVEMQLCYDEYRDDEEVRLLWEQSGAESSLMMQTMVMGAVKGSSPSAAPDSKKGKKLKASEVVEMQELMVDELKRTTDAVQVALQGGAPGGVPWKVEVAVQMVQALASAAVERRYGTSAEEMTTAGFQYAMALQKNERFVRATEKQQEILMRVASLCGP